MTEFNSVAERYLSLLKKSLLNLLYLENEARIFRFVQHMFAGTHSTLHSAITDFLEVRDSDLFHVLKEEREVGGWLTYWDMGTPEEIAARNFFFTAHTMIGKARLDNIHFCLDTIVRDKVPGDLIETGAWKGGATIFMRGYLAAHNILDRSVWVADSFDGLPPPTHEKDQGWDLSKTAFPYLCVNIEEVKELFDRYELLDDKVHFLKGWFRDTLPSAPIKQLALLRLDGDLYESTMDALQNLYPKLSGGGFVIVDDYNALPQCREAVKDFRLKHKIVDEIIPIDEVSVYWRKSGYAPIRARNRQYSIVNLLKLTMAGKRR